MPLLSICERHREGVTPWHRVRTLLFNAVVRVMPNLRRTTAYGGHSPKHRCYCTGQNMSAINQYMSAIPRKMSPRLAYFHSTGHSPSLGCGHNKPAAAGGSVFLMF